MAVGVYGQGRPVVWKCECGNGESQLEVGVRVEVGTKVEIEAVVEVEVWKAETRRLPGGVP